MRTQYLFWMVAIPFLTLVNSNAQEAGQLTPFADGFGSPVAITHAGDNRLFVVNQSGSVFIVDSSGTINPEPFLDITDKVIFDGEEGLLGLAFHPGYATNGFFYVNYVGTGDSTHISRFNVLPDNPGRADSRGEVNIMTIAQPYKNHKGGNLAFGPDGYLYIALGDGGSGGDPQNRAQNRNQLLGKILRVDVDNGDPYAIPESNPFYGQSPARNEIWAFGLRNPWRFSFDRMTGDLWIADVGQNEFEEINFQPAGSPGGENYGWRCYEGDQPFNLEECAPAGSFEFPVYAYPHGTECSVTGGFVYRGDSLSPYFGKYFFSDYCSDRIWTLHKEDGAWIKEDFGRFTGNGFSTFGEDFNGELYIAGRKSGIVYKIRGMPANVLPETTLTGIQYFYDPVTRKFRLEMTSGNSREAVLSLYDMKGVLHFRDRIMDEKYEFSTSSLFDGVYLITLRLNQKFWSHKLIIE